MKNKSIIQSFCYPLDKIQVIEQAEEKAKEQGLSLSQYIVRTLEANQKNEVGRENPLNISYNIYDLYNCLNLSLDKFIDAKDAKQLIENIPKEQLPIAFSNSKKLNQQIQFKMHGKITV